MSKKKTESRFQPVVNKAREMATDLKEAPERISERFPKKRLYRSKKDKIVGGVCGGVAEYFEVDPVIIRLLGIIGTFLWGLGLIAYLIMWIIVPKKR